MDHLILIKMNPTRKRPKVGDVFVIQPLEGIYFFGVVVRIKIPSSNPMVNGWNLVYIYRNPSRKMEIPKDLTSQELLIPPQIVNNQGWLKGYFQTIGSITLTDKDFVKDYGFWSFVKKQFVNEEGTPLGFQPEKYTDYGIGSYGSVSHDVKCVLEKSPEILDKLNEV